MSSFTAGYLKHPVETSVAVLNSEYEKYPVLLGVFCPYTGPEGAKVFWKLYPYISDPEKRTQENLEKVIEKGGWCMCKGSSCPKFHFEGHRSFFCGSISTSE